MRAEVGPSQDRDRDGMGPRGQLVLSSRLSPARPGHPPGSVSGFLLVTVCELLTEAWKKGHGSPELYPRW